MGYSYSYSYLSGSILTAATVYGLYLLLTGA